jgi:hypothetical protein
MGMMERTRGQRVEVSLSRRMVERYAMYQRLLAVIDRLDLGWYQQVEMEIYDRKYKW